MRKVSKSAAVAFMARKSFKCGNTETNGTTIYLHGNAIAWWENDQIVMTLAGWPTNTTRERLNSLCEIAAKFRPFSQSDHVQHFNGKVIDPREHVVVEMNQ